MVSRHSLVLSVTVLVSLALLNQSQAASVEECINSANECQCSMMQSSGQCMRSQGDETCLMGACNEGYRCDCLGYEICQVRQCSKYTTLADVIPSETKPFKCHLSPNAGSCTDFARFVDTVAGADNAETEASTTNDEATEDERATSEAIREMEAKKVDVNTALKRIEDYPEEVTDEERADIETDANEAVDALVHAQEEKAIAAAESREAFTSFRESAKYRAKARRKERLAKQKEEQEKAESAKAENKAACQPCEALRAEIKALRKERRDAAIAAGTWARKGHGHKKNAKARRRNVEKAQLSAEEASARCVAKSNKILARLRRSQV